MHFRVALLALLLSCISSVALAQDNELEFQSEIGPHWTSKWGLSYFNFSVADQQAVDAGSASWNIYQYFSLNYKINREQRFHIRPAFSITTPGFDERNRAQSFATRDNDFHFAYSHYSMLDEGSDYKLTGRFYAYVPTTESSKMRRWVTRLKSWMTLESNDSGRWTLQYNFKPEFYVNTQKAYKIENQFGGTTDNTQMGALDHYFELGYSLNKWFSPRLAVGATHEWYNSSSEADNKPALVENYKLSPSTWVNVTRSLRFIVGAEFLYDAKSANFSAPRDSSYYVMTFFTIL